jgi:hypothetical protein
VLTGMSPRYSHKIYPIKEKLGMFRRVFMLGSISLNPLCLSPLILSHGLEGIKWSV